MQKLGVETENPRPDPKTADAVQRPSETASRRCPWCSSQSHRTGGAWVCPVHGTEPFERR